MAFISVVIPSLNDARMLEQCLAALAQQTRHPDEVIVVNNGSTDDTASVAKSFGARIIDEPHRGVLRATVAGFDAARGEVIGRLDADSRPERDWVARIEDRLGEDGQTSVITGPGKFYGRGPFLRWFGRRIYIGGYFWFMGLFLGHSPVFGSNFAMRHSAWTDVRPKLHVQDDRMHDDLDISFCLPAHHRVEYDPQLRVKVSARPFDSISGLVRRVSWAAYGMRMYLREESLLTRRRKARAARTTARARPR